MKYQKQNQTSGAWIYGKDLANTSEAKIVGETTTQVSQFKNEDGSSKNQEVCKIRFKGKDEVYNMSLNRTNINGLIDAFGEDSKDWMNKVLGVETEKVRIAGRAGIAIYLIPDGFEKRDDDNGYAIIVKKGQSLESQLKDIPVIEEDIDVKNIPF